MTGADEVHRSVVRYPGGYAVRYRWAGSGRAKDVFALSEAGGRLFDHGTLVSPEPDRLCRAEMRVESPVGTWTARFASPIFDGPTAMYWDAHGLLVVKYGFRAYALDARSGELRWSRDSGTPILDVLGSSRLDHVIVQSEVETAAVRADGSVAWRIAHSDVVTGADLVAGRLVLTSYAHAVASYDAASGRALG